MDKQQSGENNAGAAVGSRAEAQDRDASALFTAEDSDAETKHRESRAETEHVGSTPKQPGWLKRLWRWSKREPPWWVQQIFGAGVVGLIVSLIVGGGLFFAGKHFTDIQARQTLQLENLRFLRDRVATAPNQRFQFARLDLEGQGLDMLPLAHANFSFANLRGAQLAGSDLTGADFSGANLRGANLSGAYLVGANLCGADLTGAFAYAASLPAAILTGANLTRAEFEHAVLTGAKFSSATFQADERISESCWVDSGRTNLTETRLCSSDLAGADLKEASNLTSAKFNHVHYDEKTTWPDGFRPPPSQSLSPLGDLPSGQLANTCKP